MLSPVERDSIPAQAFLLKECLLKPIPPKGEGLYPPAWKSRKRESLDEFREKSLKLA
jgi:hypothetical protein